MRTVDYTSLNLHILPVPFGRVPFRFFQLIGGGGGSEPSGGRRTSSKGELLARRGKDRLDSSTAPCMKGAHQGGHATARFLEGFLEGSLKEVLLRRVLRRRL